MIMSGVRVVPVVSRKQKKQFLQLPWVIYQRDPLWVPPLRSMQREMVGIAPHPFYETNEIQLFIAYRGSEVVGRIAAILNHGHNQRYNEKRGFFGFFESIDDQEVASGLFDAVAAWFAERDIHQLRGPTNPSLNHEVGLLIDGFDKSPTFMMTYNPSYYVKLVEGYGFEKSQDLLSFYGHIDMLPKIHERYGPVSEQIVDHFGLKIRSLDQKRFMDDVTAFLNLYNESLVNTWGFVPMSDGEVRHMARGLRRLLVPELALVAELDGRVIGVLLGLPDYNPRIREINGRLFPFGFLHLLRNKRAIKKVRMISTNVLPEYQRMGVGLALMSALVPDALKYGLQEAEFSWVLE
ncbi:MAG: GNAT family N-acetyltransferase, partial [Planctomycetia bacterium]